MPAADANTNSHSNPNGDSYTDSNTEPNSYGYCYSQGYAATAANPAFTSQSSTLKAESCLRT